MIRRFGIVAMCAMGVLGVGYADPVASVVANHAVMPVPFVSSIPSTHTTPDLSLRNKIVETAKKYIGVRYNFGGMSEKGFDCSGFVNRVYRENGIALPRTSKAQFSNGKKVSLKEAKPGDIVYFVRYPRRRATHVGIYLGDSQFIHAPSRGKRVSISNIGQRYWRHRLIGVVSYLPKNPE